ncbi:MAG: hypothetical protein NTY77_11055 [Elusimicrobia bacterium]|nr:hypothetical protein [Elusimicrobiota bacterium]
MSEDARGAPFWPRLLARPGFIETLLALAVLGLYHKLLIRPAAGWGEFLYPLGASWGFRDWRGLGAIFTPTYWVAFCYGKGDWVPATFVWFFLERWLGGARPLAVNGGALALLTVNSWLVAAVGRRLTGRPLAGLVAGLAFCLHPLLWDASKLMLTSHLLMSLFGLLAFWAHLKGREPGRRSAAWTALACGSYLLAMFSKPPGVVFPALLLVHELFWARDADPWPRRLRRGSLALLPYLLPAGIFFLLFHWVHPGLQLLGVTSAGFSKGWTIQDPILRIKEVVELLLGRPQGPAVFGLCTALLLCAAFSGRFLFFLAWSLVALFPYLNLIPLEGLSRAMSSKDFQPRYALLACIAFSWTAAAGLIRGLDRGGIARRASQGLLILLGLAAGLRVCRPVRSGLPAQPMTRLLSLPFVRAADPRAYEALLEEASARYGAQTAAAFSGISGSGLLYEDPDLAGLVRHAVYALDFHPLFDPALPEAFLDRLRSAVLVQRDWERARDFIARGDPGQALAALQEVLRRDPNHAQAALAASVLLWREGRVELAKHLYVLARTETGLGHAALVSIACARLGADCARLGLADGGYRDAMRKTRGADLDAPGPLGAGLVREDQDFMFSYARAMAVDEHFLDAERAFTAALRLLERGAPQRRAAVLLQRAEARQHCQDQAGAAADLDAVRRLGP